MIRTILLASAVTIAAPVVAQTAAPAPQMAPVAPATTATPSATVGTQANTGQVAPMPAASMTAQTQAAPAAPADTAAPQAAEAAPASGDQVASAVDTQFGTYDKNADGKLDKTEFASWMVALKTASDPATKADSPATKKWVGAAFAQADTNKNASLDKAEVTGFLAQGQS